LTGINHFQNAVFKVESFLGLLSESDKSVEELPVIEEDFLPPLKIDMIPCIEEKFEQPLSHHSLPSSI
jgi:hypothetical protein